METIIFFGIIGICLVVVLVIFCRLVYHLNKQIKKASPELKRQKKLEELRAMGIAIYYNTKTQTYLAANGREIPELGNTSNGTLPPTDNDIILVWITDKN